MEVPISLNQWPNRWHAKMADEVSAEETPRAKSIPK
jgi:hypothetical protein